MRSRVPSDRAVRNAFGDEQVTAFFDALATQYVEQVEQRQSARQTAYDLDGYPSTSLMFSDEDEEEE